MSSPESHVPRRIGWAGPSIALAVALFAVVWVARPWRGLDRAETRPAAEPISEADAPRRASEALAANDLAGAERAFRAILSREPESIEALQGLARVLAMERRPEEAREAFRELHRLTRDPRPLADCLLVAGNESESRELGVDLDAALRQAPDNPWLRRARGLTRLNQGRLDEAARDLEWAAAAFENDPAGRFALAECRMAMGGGPVVVEVLGPTPAKAVEAARWWVWKSRLEVAAGHTDDATASLERAVELDPRDTEALYALGQALLRLGKPEEARIRLARAETLGVALDSLKKELRLLVRENPDADSPLRIGRLCAELGLFADARDWFRQGFRSQGGRDAYRDELDRLPSVEKASAEAASVPVLVATRAAKPGTLPKAEPRAAASARFEDVAEGAGLRFRYESGQTPNLFIGDTMGGGVALIDFDGDGRLDVYFVNGCRLPIDADSMPSPNKLFRNLGNLVFEDATDRAGVAGRGYGMGCAVGDYDNDGDADLFATGLAGTLLYRNAGDGTFADVTAEAGVSSARWTTAAGFADLDADGDLDLVVITYVDASPTDPIECRDRSGRLIHCQPARFNAQPDHLFRNNGDGTFTDVAVEAGFDGPEGRGLGLAIADLDDDGRLDVFVANDGTANFLFRNLGGLKFEEVGLASGVAYDGAGQPTASMGVVADDLDGDGRIDLFHTNFLNQSSTLRLNLGGGFFADGTMAARLGAPSRARTGWGASAFDADRDGRIDLFVANGHVDDQPWIGSPMAQLPQWFIGQGDGRFAVAGTEVSPYFARPVTGRGVASGDLDDDGRVDLVVVHRDTPAALLRNVSEGGHWLGVSLRARASGSAPVGARVVCVAGGHAQSRWLTAGTGYLSSSDQRMTFGLGAAPRVERLEVTWPSGFVQTWPNPPIDRYLDLIEGE